MAEKKIDEKLYTSKDIASIFRCSVKTVLRMHRKKTIISCGKKGRELIFTKSAIDEYLKGCSLEMQDAYRYTY